MQTEIHLENNTEKWYLWESYPSTCRPFYPDHFYVADGWGSKYASMRLHKLSFSTGKEVANVLIRNSVRCMYFRADGQYLFAITDNKIFQLSRETLAVVKKHEKGIPKFSDYVASNDQDTLILMNFNSITVTAYNYVEESTRKKRIKGEGCALITREKPDTYLIASDQNGVIQRYNTTTTK